MSGLDMVVDGFRGTDQPTMDAFQYFLVDGEPVGKAPIGELDYHAGAATTIGISSISRGTRCWTVAT